MNDNVTIQEDFSLPSKGQIYTTKFDPNVKLRSMTVAEEMKRLTATDFPYKAMADIIEACLLTELPMSVYDMCLGDYQYLLHKLRIVTYGPDYRLNMICPYCNNIYETTVNLDELEVFEYDQSIEELKTFILPVTGKAIEIGFQTPRDLDNIERNKKELKQKFPDMKDDPTLMLNAETLIKSVDGKTLPQIALREFIKKLPMKDFSLIFKKAEDLNSKVGIDTRIKSHCDNCGNDVNSSFRFTGEFFRPEIN